MNMENRESAKEEFEPKDPVIEALESKLKDLRDFGGKVGKAAISRYEKLLDQINKGDKKVYEEAAREFGLGEIQEGKQVLGAQGMKRRELSPEEEKHIEENLNRYD